MCHANIWFGNQGNYSNMPPLKFLLHGSTFHPLNQSTVSKWGALWVGDSVVILKTDPALETAFTRSRSCLSLGTLLWSCLGLTVEMVENQAGWSWHSVIMTMCPSSVLLIPILFLVLVSALTWSWSQHCLGLGLGLGLGLALVLVLVCLDPGLSLVWLGLVLVLVLAWFVS